MFQNKASATKHPKMANLRWSSKSQLIRSFVQESTKKYVIRHMVGSVGCFGPKTPRSTMLIEHRLSYLNRGLVLAFNYTILLRHIRRGKLMLESYRSTEGLKLNIIELCANVTVNHSHGFFGKLILQHKKQISSMNKSLILLLHEEHPRIVRKIVNDHKHIPHPQTSKPELDQLGVGVRVTRNFRVG
jgi:hypothetical protein